jgi:hypothetical protein
MMELAVGQVVPFDADDQEWNNLGAISKEAAMEMARVIAARDSVIKERFVQCSRHQLAYDAIWENCEVLIVTKDISYTMGIVFHREEFHILKRKSPGWLSMSAYRPPNMRWGPSIE